MIEEVLDYVVRGWAVIPVDSLKHPLTRNGVKDASSDPAVIRGWWTKWPTANVGIATGEPSHMVVIDIDVKSGGKESWSKLVAEHGGIPPTLEATTPSGGGHLYFQAPPYVVKNSVSSVAPGVDVRGDRGYVVAPPSILGNGAYQWVNSSVPPSVLPDWLAQMLNTASHQSLATGEILEGVTSGRRDIAAFTLARRLRSAGTPFEVTKRMVIMAAANDEPPLDETIALDKVERVYKQFLKQYQFTDKGNAERLLDRHGDILRRVQAGADSRWAVYEDGRWQDSSQDYPTYLMLETTEAILSEAMLMPSGTDEERDRRARSIQYALRCQSGERIQMAVRIAGSDRTITIPLSNMDSNPMLLNCLNGTLDLSTGQMSPHDRRDLITKSTSCYYDPDAVCPLWDKTLETVLPDAEVRSFFGRAIGYSLTGSVSEQVLFFLYGTGANGKSTVIKTIHKVLGNYARTGSSDILLLSRNEAHPTGIADLAGARFVPTIELEDGRWLAEAQLKSLTGGDNVKARKMHQDFFEFDPQFKVWMVGNHRPSVRGTDPAIWRRILLVPFTVTIPEEDRDIHLQEKLMAEAPGILAWAVRACQEWQALGLRPPSVVKQATQKYRDDENVLQQFCNTAFEIDSDGKVKDTEAYMAYCGYCKVVGERPLTLRKFNGQMEDMGYHGSRGGQNRLQWSGLKMNTAGREYIVSAGGGVDIVTFRSAN